MSFTDILRKAYPFISTAAALGGPLGEMGAAALGKVLGADVKAPDLQSALSSLVTSEQGRIQLDAAEKNFQETMAKMGFDNAENMAKIAADDRASARQMQSQVRSWVPPTLAIMVTVGFFGLLGFMATHTIPSSSEKILDVMDGSLGTAWIGIITYYFGSSAGSDRKTELMAQTPGTH